MKPKSNVLLGFPNAQTSADVGRCLQALDLVVEYHMNCMAIIMRIFFPRVGQVSPSLVVIDSILPWLQGDPHLCKIDSIEGRLEVVKRIRLRRPAIKIILVANRFEDKYGLLKTYGSSDSNFFLLGPAPATRDFFDLVSTILR